MIEKIGFLINKNNINLFEPIFKKNKNKKIFFEIGSGNGEYITELAYKENKAFFIASEIKAKRIRKILKKIYRLNLKNTLAIYGAGDIFTYFYIENKSIDNFILNFPDPWFKKRHKKRRLLNYDFFKIMWNKLKKNGNIYIATDYQEYAEIILQEAIMSNLFLNTRFSNKWLLPDIFTKYEKNFLAQGKNIYYLHLIKKDIE